MRLERIAVVGGGAWGTALALTLRRAGREVILWAREREVVEAILRRRENTLFLPGITLDPPFAVTDVLHAALEEVEGALLAVPAQHLRAMTGELGRLLAPKAPLILCAKGFEQATGALLSEVLAETLAHHALAVVTGPTFAIEVARGLPAAVTVAAQQEALAQTVARAIGGPVFRPYVSNDPIGAEIGGAVKNVVAIACGIVVGRGLGENARAALLARGLAEMTRLGVAKGGRAETFMGLSGLGDLALTCNSMQSRNMSLGVALGEGKPLDAVLAHRRSIAEGVWTAPAVVTLARKLGIEMPIAAAVDAILHHGADIDESVEALMRRPLKAE